MQPGCNNVVWTGIHWCFRALIIDSRILDTMHTIFACIFIYHLTVSNYGQPNSLNQIHWSYVGVEGLDTVMAVAVQVPAICNPFYIQNLMYGSQSFFAYRIMGISRRLDIGLFSWLICTIRLGMGLFVTALTAKVWFFAEYLRSYEWTIPTALSILAFGDLLNTSALCYFLSSHRTECPK